MKILFCNIAWMDYYKGVIAGKDVPRNGGAYVAIHNDAHEAYNFDAVKLGENVGYPEAEYCLGFVETKATNKKTRNQLNIEKINVLVAALSQEAVEQFIIDKYGPTVVYSYKDCRAVLA